MSNSADSTTLHVNAKRKSKIDNLTLKVSLESQKMIRWTDLVNYAIDEYLDEAAKDLIETTKNKKN